MKTPNTRFSAILFTLLAVAGNSAGFCATGPFAEPMTALPDSILRVDQATGRFLGRSGRVSPLAGRVTQAAVDPSADVKFHVALEMRKLDELRARLAKGEVLSQAEMAEKYYPLAQDWQSVADWLTAQGLQVVPENPKAPLHLGVIAHGRLDAVSRTLGVEFATVQGADGKIYNSAISAPSVPSRLADKVIGVTGLQPHIRPQVQQVSLPVTPDGEALQSGGVPFNPPQYFQTMGPLALLNYYRGLSTAHGGTLPFTGAGQTIAIMMTQDDVAMLQSDLVQFWAGEGSSHTLADFTVVNPGWYAPVTGQNASNNQTDAECTIDLEWTSGMAEGAKIRLYETIGAADFVPQIIADKATILGLNQASGSFGYTENGLITPVQENSDTQYYASLAAAGITYFAPTGDYGSNPDTDDDGPGYPTWPLSVLYPACDPSVVGVGGTETYFPGGTDPLITYGAAYDTTTVAEEDAWYASGGGYSQVFTRPPWQIGLGASVTANANGNSGQAMRTVPDVSAMAGGSGLSFYTVTSGTTRTGAGTSFSSPIWAGVCALINQARTAANEPVVGLLAPRLYAIGATPQYSQAFNDIITLEGTPNGQNPDGPYYPGPGYDLLTGLGTPNIAGLIAALTGATITANPVSQTINLGSTVTFVAAATPPTAPGTLSYRWQLNGANLSDGTNANGTIIAGSQGAQLLLTNSATTDAGNYTCVVTFTPTGTGGSPASLSTSAANLIVTAGTTPGAVSSISARSFVGKGDNILIGGFYIAGSTSATVLIQAIGPSLAQAPYNVTGTLQKPALTIHQSQNGKDVVLYSNTGWGSNSVLLTAAAAAYAEPVLTPGSADSELLLTLPPGGYTAEVTGADDGTGVALCAIYQLQ